MESLTDAQRALFTAGGSLEDYDVLKPIGKGKFSVVYKAVRKLDAQPVALKKIAIFDMMDAKAREKTLKETNHHRGVLLDSQVRLVQSVHHPNIIQYMDAFITNNELYIAFEWAEAGDLKRQVRKANEKSVRFDERTIWRYFTQLCAAIQHLHRARIMHRDLKPANIFLTLKGVVKVGDLGLGRHLSEDTMEAHSKVGTPLYMSPEVLRGDGYDWKSDVWSLGCILYELAMLRSPFKSEGLNLYGLFQKINKGDYQEVPPIYSDHLRRLVTRMISLNAADRPTMEQVWESCQQRPASATLVERQRMVMNKGSDVSAAASITKRTTPPQQTNQRENEAVRPSSSSSQPQEKSRSRPSSRQQDEDRSSQSRPQSAQSDSGAAAAAVADDGTVAMLRRSEMHMEMLFEKLKILRYEQHLGKRISPKHFTAEYRSLPPVTPQSRFEDMCCLAKWLLTRLGVAMEDQSVNTTHGDTASPVVTVQLLLLAAGRANVEGVAHLSAPALTSGVGEDVCILLDLLAENVIRIQRTCCQPAQYQRETVECIGDDDDLDDPDAASATTSSTGDSTTSTPVLADNDEDDTFAKWLVVKDECDASAATDHCEMIRSAIDPAAWKREMQQMLPKLRLRIQEEFKARPFGSSWQARVEMIQQSVAVYDSDRNRTCTALSGTQQLSHTQVERMQAVEDRVNSEFRNARRRFYEAKEQAALRERDMQTLKARVDTATAALTPIQTACASAALALTAHNEQLTDDSSVRTLRQQLRQLCEDNLALYRRLELVRNRVARQESAHQQLRQRLAAVRR